MSSTTHNSRAREEDPRIINPTEVMNCLGRITSMAPSGEEVRPLIDNPRLDERDPRYMRVAVPRKGISNMKVIEAAAEMGLYVKDVWQLDADRENEVVKFKLVRQGAL